MNTDFVRRQMVEQQIRTWDVFDASVLEVFGNVPRDEFVPDYCSNAAYADTEIPLAHQQCMLRPSIVGKVLQALEIGADDDVLEIGTGTGYLTACLAQRAGTVTSIDIFDDFIAQASENLARTEVDNASVQCMDATKELPAGQFDVIIMTSSVSAPDDRLIAALKPGGRLFMVVGESPVKSAMLLRSGQDGRFETTTLFETDIPALLNVDKPSGFLFRNETT